MANETTRGRSTKQALKKENVKTLSQSNDVQLPEERSEYTAENTATERPERISVKEIDPHMIVTVRNGFQGRLVYKSRKTGERFVWETFGAEQDMEIGEVRNARNSNKKYFSNNWFMFDEPWIVDYIGVSQYYKNAILIAEFDDVFALPADEVAEKINGLSDGQKKSVAYRARQLIAEEEIDSNKVIAALEHALGVELVERN